MRSLLALAATLALVGSACGSDDDGVAAAPAGTEAETAAPTEQTAAPATDVPAGTAAADDGTGSDESAADDRADWPDTIVMGAVPSEESTALVESYAKLIEVLEADLGVEVEFFQATDYAGIIEAQIAGRVDIAQYGPFSYVIAKSAGANIEPIGAIVDSPDDVPGYRSYGITRSDNDEIDSLADFAGRTVCFVDPGSTSGYLYPSAGLLAEGIDPEADVTPVFAGGHDASVISVDNGDCEAGFAFDEMVDSALIESGDIAEGAIKKVWESEIIAGSPIAVSLDLPADLAAEIRRIVLEEANADRLLERGICEDLDNCGLTDENSWGWVPVDDAFFDGVRAVCDETRSAQCQG